MQNVQKFMCHIFALWKNGYFCLTQNQYAMHVNHLPPTAWRTFQGKAVTPQSASHQHLSNTYWFNLIFNDRKEAWIQKELNDRFNGQLLEYRPHSDYEAEIDSLRDRMMLFYKGSDHANDEVSEDDPCLVYREEEIHYKGNIIGRIITIC